MLVEVYDLSALAAEMLYLSVRWATQGASLFWYHVQDAVVKVCVSTSMHKPCYSEVFATPWKRKPVTWHGEGRLRGTHESPATYCPFRDY